MEPAWGELMIGSLRAAFALSLMMFLAGSASAAPNAAAPTSHASATKNAPGGSAKFYFLRSLGALDISRPDITIDGKVVGTLAAGGSFTVTRPPGLHTVGVRMGILGLGAEVDVQAAAGKTYFIEVGPKPEGAIGTDLINGVLGGFPRGTPMRPKSINFSGVQLYSLTPAEAQAELKKFSDARKH